MNHKTKLRRYKIMHLKNKPEVNAGIKKSECQMIRATSIPVKSVNEKEDELAIDPMLTMTISDTVLSSPPTGYIPTGF